MKFLLTPLFVLCVSACFSQNVLKKSNESGQLPWVSGKLPSNATFYNYKVVQGQGVDLIQARKNTIQNLAFELGTERGVNISSETISKIQEKIEDTNAAINSEFSKKVTISQPGFDVVFSKIDEYYELVSENGGLRYNVWHLYAIGNRMNTPKKLHYTSKYNFSNAGFRSALAPGWGQFYKKQNSKGFLFAISAAAAIGGFVYCNNEYNYNKNRLAETSSLDLQKEFSSRADDFNSLKNIALGAIAVTWIWSVVDAISTEGPPKYVSAKKIKFNIHNISKNEGLALSLKYTF